MRTGPEQDQHVAHAAHLCKFPSIYAHPTECSLFPDLTYRFSVVPCNLFFHPTVSSNSALDPVAQLQTSLASLGDYCLFRSISSLGAENGSFLILALLLHLLGAICLLFYNFHHQLCDYPEVQFIQGRTIVQNCPFP